MIILGIDPALAISGYGVIQLRPKHIDLLEAGVIITKAKDPVELRLNKIYQAVIKLIVDFNPDCLVLEKIFSHYKHPATSFVLGEARGVICLAAANKQIPLAEYAATRIKKAIVGKGLASKTQVQKMIVNLLGIKELPKYTDVTDALALAIGHSYIIRAKL